MSLNVEIFTVDEKEPPVGTLVFIFDIDRAGFVLEELSEVWMEFTTFQQYTVPVDGCERLLMTTRGRSVAGDVQWFPLSKELKSFLDVIVLEESDA